MAIVTSLTAARMLAIEAASVVSGAISGNDLILTKHDGSVVNAGNVRGPQGNVGAQGLGVNAFPGRNRIINGSFRVNQRGFSTSTGWPGTETFDRWVFASSGGTAVLTKQSASLGVLPESMTDFARIEVSGQSASGHYSRLFNKIENVATLSGKNVTVSFYARASSGTPSVAVSCSQFFGSGGGASDEVDVPLGKVQISTTWTRYSVTGTLPSIAGKTIGTLATNFLSTSLWTSAGSVYSSETNSLGVQNATIEFWGVQLEEGSNLTLFDTQSYGSELLACQRYFVSISGTSVNPMFGGGNAVLANFANVPINLPTTMRIPPHT